MKRHISIILLASIFVLGIVVRFIGLGQNPPGIINDEADTAYDAYSLLVTGKDQWGTPWPLTSFRGFGDYRLPLYTYLTIPAISLFGLTPLAVRVPSALFGSLTILLVYWLMKELFGRTSALLPLLAALFIAISPWHIGMSRIGLEETTSVFIVTGGLLMILRGRKHPVAFIVGMIMLGISLYTYTANTVFVPLLLILLLFLFRNMYRRMWKHVGIGLLCFVLLLGSLYLSGDSNTASTRTRQVNLTTNSALIDIVNEKQGACLQKFHPVICRIAFNRYNVFAHKFISNYINHFSPNFLSIYGTDTQFSILPSRGLLYLFDYPLIILSLVAVMLMPSPQRLLIVGWLFLSAIPDSLTSDGHYGRFFVSYPAWSMLIALGVTSVLSKIKYYKRILACIVVLLCLFGLSNFVVEYWSFFPYRYSKFSHYGYSELVRHIQANVNLYDKIVVSSRVNDAKQYIYFLFYTRYDPGVFQSNDGIEKIEEPNGWVRVKRIKSIEFVDSVPTAQDIGKEHVLLIGAPTEFNSKIPATFYIRDLKGDILFQGVDSQFLY